MPFFDQAPEPDHSIRGFFNVCERLPSIQAPPGWHWGRDGWAVVMTSPPIVLRRLINNIHPGVSVVASIHVDDFARNPPSLYDDLAMAKQHTCVLEAARWSAEQLMQPGALAELHRYNRGEGM